MRTQITALWREDNEIAGDRASGDAVRWVGDVLRVLAAGGLPGASERTHPRMRRDLLRPAEQLLDRRIHQRPECRFHRSR